MPGRQAAARTRAWRFRAMTVLSNWLSTIRSRLQAILRKPAR